MSEGAITSETNKNSLPEQGGPGWVSSWGGPLPAPEGEGLGVGSVMFDGRGVQKPPLGEVGGGYLY